MSSMWRLRGAYVAHTSTVGSGDVSYMWRPHGTYVAHTSTVGSGDVSSMWRLHGAYVADTSVVPAHNSTELSGIPFSYVVVTAFRVSDIYSARGPIQGGSCFPNQSQSLNMNIPHPPTNHSSFDRNFFFMLFLCGEFGPHWRTVVSWSSRRQLKQSPKSLRTC